MSASHSTPEGESPVSPYSQDKSPEPISPFDYAPEVDKSAQAPEIDRTAFAGELQTIQYGDAIEAIPGSRTQGAWNREQRLGETTEKPGKRRPYFKIALIATVVIIVVVIALSVGLTFGLRIASNQSSPTQTATPTSTSLPTSPTSTPPSGPTKDGIMNDTSIAGLSSPDTNYIFYQDVNGNLRVGTYSQSEGIFNFEEEPIRTGKPPRNHTPITMVSLTNPDTQENLQFLSYVNSDNMLAIYGFVGDNSNITTGQDFLIGDYPVNPEGRRISAAVRKFLGDRAIISSSANPLNSASFGDQQQLNSELVPFLRGSKRINYGSFRNIGLE